MLKGGAQNLNLSISYENWGISKSLKDIAQFQKKNQW